MVAIETIVNGLSSVPQLFENTVSGTYLYGPCQPNNVFSQLSQLPLFFFITNLFFACLVFLLTQKPQKPLSESIQLIFSQKRTFLHILPLNII